MLTGIDVSHHQGTINFDELVRNGEITGFNVDFMIAKATQGASFIDGMFDRNIKCASENGILTGAYHYMVGNLSWSSQVHHFCDVVERYANKDTLLAIDVEDRTLLDIGYKAVGDMVYYMVADIYERLHTYPVIYASQAFMHPKTFEKVSSLCAGWIARWGAIDKKPSRSDLNTTIWQYSDHGNLLGIKGNVDLDRAYLTREAWRRIANPKGER